MRKQRRRIVSIILAVLMIISCLSGCATSLAPDKSDVDTDDDVVISSEMLDELGDNMVALGLNTADHGSVYFTSTTDSTMTAGIGTNVTLAVYPETGYKVSEALFTSIDGEVTELTVEGHMISLTAEQSGVITVAFDVINETITGGSLMLEIEETEEEAISVEDYILDNADRSLVGEGDELGYANMISVSHIFVDGTKLPDATFDSLWSVDEDGDGISDNFGAAVSQFEDYVMLYDISDDSDYLVGKVSREVPHASITDWAAGQNDYTGTVYEDIIYDDETKLVYVPKYYHYVDGSYIVGMTRIQLLCCVEELGEATLDVDITINDGGIDGNFAISGVGHASYINPFTELVLAADEETRADFKLNMIDSIEINGIEYENPSDMWDYDDETGILSIYMSAAVVDTVKVNMSNGLLKKIGNFFADIKSGITASAVVYGPEGEFIFEGDPVPGLGFVISADAVYTDAKLGNEIKPALTPAAYGSPQALKQLIDDSLDGNSHPEWTAIENGDETLLVYNSTNTWNVGIPEMDYDAGGVKVHIPSQVVTLVCSHLARVNTNFVDVGGDYNTNTDRVSMAYFSIMAVSSDWIYYTIVTPTSHNQSGVGIFRARYTGEFREEWEWEIPTTGRVQVFKYSEHPEYTEGNAAYVMPNSTYGIYNGAGTLMCTLTITGGNGESEWSPQLEAGVYTAREISSGTGFLVNGNSQQFTIYAGADTTVHMQGNSLEPPVTDPLSLLIQKSVQFFEPGAPMGDLENLGGIQFRVNYYNNLYNSSAEAIASGEPNASAVFETDERGLLYFATARPVEGYWPYINDRGNNYLPLGTVVIIEESAMDGLYVRAGSDHAFQIVDDGNRNPKHIKLDSWTEPESLASVIGVFNNRTEEVWHGGITVWKADYAGYRSIPEGDGSLADITYDIINKSLNPVIVNGVMYDVDEVVMTIKTVETPDGYYATTGEKVLPYGTYLIKEVSGNDSYHNAFWEKTVVIHEDGQMDTFDKNNGWNLNPVKRGGIEVVKADWDTGRSEPQGDADFNNTQFAIFNRSKYDVYVNGVWYKPDDRVMTIATEWDEDEQVYIARTGGHVLPYGTYEVVEVQPPEGYHISLYRETVYIHDEGDVQSLYTEESNYNKDRVWRGGVSVIKADADWHTSEPQGDATLSGVVYTITNRSEHSVFLTSTGKEYAPGEVVMRIDTAWNDLLKAYYATSGAEVLPYGTYDITEFQICEGYLNANWTQRFTIRRHGQMVEYNSETMNWNENEVQRGGIIVGKVDRETGQYISLGEAHLDGSVFEIINRSKNPVYVNGKTYQVGDVVMNIATEAVEWNGRMIYAAQTGNYVLPYGTYEVREIMSGTGYLYDSASKAYTQTVQIREDGQIIDLTIDDENNTNAVANQVLREDWHFKKKAEDSMDAMANVAFLVTSMTTGERHVIVTDENGQWGSSAFNDETSFRLHTQRTNSNDPTSPISNGAMAVDEDGNWYVADSSKLDCDAGVWFTGMPEDMTNWISGLAYEVNGRTVLVNDSLRAFPYDTYKVEELPCDANKGYKLVSFTVVLHRYTTDHDGPGLDIDYGTIDDKKITVDTFLKFDYIDKVIPNGPEVTITDTLIYGGLEPGKYTLMGELHLLNDDMTDGGVVATTEIPFAVASDIGSREVPFTLDTTPYGGKKLVAFEYLYKDGQLYGQHAELDDPDQTVTVLEIHTTLNGDLEHMGYGSSKTITLTDTIAYNGLEPGKLYTADGILMDHETGKPVTDASGNPFTATQRFTVDKPVGTIDIVFTFSDVDLAGKTVTAFETVSRNGVEYAVHTDINDESQTVYFPEISSYAVNTADGNKDLAEAPGQYVTDALKVTNLMDGYTYKLDGELHVRSKDGEDEGIVSTSEITWEGAAQNLTMTFADIDASGLGGKDLVIFQTLYGRKDENSAWVLLGTDNDLFNENQSVHVPHIGTLLQTEQGLHEIQVPENGIVTLTDTVSYENLTPGHQYVMTGVLHMQNIANDGEETTVEDGGATNVTAKAAFVPEESDGTVDVVFTFDASDFAGKTVTAYESLYSSPASEIPEEWKNFFDDNSENFNTEEPKDEWKVAVHEEITDETQSVHFVEIGTTMTSDSTGIHMMQVTGNGTVSLTDVVTYTNLIPGNEYTISGTPHIQAVDENGNIVDGGAVTDEEGNEITGSYTFVPVEPDGEVEITFTFDASHLIGQTVVAFESVSNKDIVFAVHADITDESQSTHFVEIGTTASAENGLHMMQIPEGSDYVTVTDRIAYTNLIPGLEYTMDGTLHYQGVTGEGTIFDAGTVNGANGNPIVGTVTFTPETADGYVDMTFNIETYDLAGRTTVAFEQLSIDGTVIATHEDITDEGQAVHFVDIHTTALSEDGIHLVQLPKEGDAVITIIDAVTFTNLIPGEEYSIAGTLHIQDIDEDGNIIDGGAVKDVNGNDVTGVILPQARGIVINDLPADEEVAEEVTEGITEEVTDEETADVEEDAEEADTEEADEEEADVVDVIPEEVRSSYVPTGSTTFIATEANGSVDIIFTFDASGLNGKTTVAFESLSFEDVIIAAHEDITDEGQSIHFVDMGTTALTENLLHIAQGGEGIGVLITDTITYKNLIPGKIYTVEGTLHIQETDEEGNIIDGGVVKNSDGTDLTSYGTFVPETPDGSVDVTFMVDTTELAGKTVTAFETMSTDGVRFAIHADITDEAQSINFVEIGTTALTEDGLHMFTVTDGTVKLIDTIAYRNIIPGWEYTMTGTLHLQALDEEGNIIDGGVLTDADDIPVTSSVTFTPDEADGSVDVTFTFDADLIADGSTLVAFESLGCMGVVIATHQDITDEEQSVHDVKIGTSAVAENGESSIEISDKKTVTITDTVTYENLIPGVEYTMTGTPHIQNRDKDGNITDGGELKGADGKPVVSEVTFTPEKADGTVEVKFVIDTSRFTEGCTLTAFETLKAGDVIVAVHHDITDSEQSVIFTLDKPVKIGTKASVNNSQTVQLPIKGSVTITLVDTVSYEDAVPGREYTLFGTLHVQKKDAQGNIVDGGKLEDKDGNVITAKVTFTPESANGSVDVPFEVSTYLIPDNGFTLVAFEALSCNDVVIATHEDITDKDQSVTFVPETPASTPAPTPSTSTKPTTPPETVKTGQNLYLVTGVAGLALMSGGGFLFFTKTAGGRKLRRKICSLIGRLFSKR